MLEKLVTWLGIEPRSPAVTIEINLVLTLMKLTLFSYTGFDTNEIGTSVDAFPDAERSGKNFGPLCGAKRELSCHCFQ